MFESEGKNIDRVFSSSSSLAYPLSTSARDTREFSRTLDKVKTSKYEKPAPSDKHRKNKATTMADAPEDLGQRLPRLRKLELSRSASSRPCPPRSPVRRSWRKQDLWENDLLQVEEPLNWLLEPFPLLRKVKLAKERETAEPWTTAALANLEAFAEKLDAEVDFLEFFF